MEGTVGNFGALLTDLEKRLPQASFIAIDLEMTGASFETDSLLDSIEDRYQRVKKAAEQFSMCQLGLTLGSDLGDGTFALSSYNITTYPTQATRPNFLCASGGLKFLSRNGFNFNSWIKDGILTRPRTLTPTGQASMDGEGSQRLWTLLCDAQKPLIAHSALTDLAFLFAALEALPLPDSLAEFGKLVRRLTPKVFDTAHLHTVVGAAIGKFKRLGVAKFLEEAQQRAGENARFELHGDDTQKRYGPNGSGQSHEAGYDSFMTAKLYCCLRVLASTVVDAESNRIFFWRCAECVELCEDVGAKAHPAYYTHCEAFHVTIQEGAAEKSLAEMKDLWRHGADKESLGNNDFVVIWPRDKPEQQKIAIPSSLCWTPLPWPPRPPKMPASEGPAPTEKVEEDNAEEQLVTTKKRPASFSLVEPAKKRPGAAKATFKRPALN